MLNQFYKVLKQGSYGVAIFALSFLLTIFVLNHTPNYSKPIIPHKIHYVWFGRDDVPPTVAKAIKSWQKYLPGWEITRWNEDNCNVNDNDFIKQTFKTKNYQFASDFCRFYALEKEGGIYLDTDMFLTAPVEPLLIAPLVLIWEHKNTFSGGILAVQSHHPFIAKLLSAYRAGRSFNKDGSFKYVPVMISDVFNEWIKENPVQEKSDYLIYPTNVMMLDFGGPENVAEHWYANGKADFDERGYFYNYFSKLFLDENAYKLIDKQDKELKFSIVLPNNQCYFVKLKKDRLYSTTPNQTFPCYFNENILVLLPQKQVKQVYQCHQQVCQKLVIEK